jgi:hypothetical protein
MLKVSDPLIHRTSVQIRHIVLLERQQAYLELPEVLLLAFLGGIRKALIRRLLFDIDTNLFRADRSQTSTSRSLADRRGKLRIQFLQWLRQAVNECISSQDGLPSRSAEERIVDGVQD